MRGHDRFRTHHLQYTPGHRRPASRTREIMRTPVVLVRHHTGVIYAVTHIVKMSRSGTETEDELTPPLLWCRGCRQYRAPKEFENNNPWATKRRHQRCAECRATSNRRRDPERHRARTREYLLKPGVAERRRAHRIAQEKANDALRILRNCRSRIRSSLRMYRSGRVHKCAKSMTLLGSPSWEVFRDHIERQFQMGMTWGNYGKWHLDHRIPCAAFDIRNPEEQRMCFHYKNLQPMWGADNLSKSASYRQSDLDEYRAEWLINC